MSKQELIVTLGLNSATFQQQLKALNKELKLHEQEYKRLESTNKNFEKTQEGLSAKMKATQKSMDFAKASVKLYEDAYVNATQALKKALEEQRQYNDKLGETKNKLSQAKGSLDDNRQSVQFYAEELSKAKKEHKNVAREVTSLEKQLAKANDTYSKQGERIENLTSKYNKQKSVYDEVKNKLDNEIANQVKLRKSYADSERAVERYQVQLNQTTDNYLKNNAKLEQHQRLLNVVEKKYGTNSQKAQQLRATISKLENQNEKYIATIEKQTQKLDKVENKHQQLGNEMNKQGAKVQNLTNKLKTLQGTLDKYQSDIEKAKQKQNDAINSIERLIPVLAKAKTEYDVTAQKVKEMTAELQNAKLVYGANSQQVKELESEVKGLQSQFERASKNVERFSNEMRDTQTNIAKAETQINKLNQELQETAVKMATLKLNNFSDSMKKISGTLQNVGTPLRDIGSALTTHVSAPLVAMGALAGKTFLSFDKQVQRSATLIGKEGKTISETYDILEKGARELGKSTIYSAEDVAKGYEYMAMASWSVTDAVKAMPSVLNLATIGMIDLGQASDIVTDYMTPFKMSADESSKFVDIMATTIVNANTDIEMMGETLKYVAPVAGTLGISMEETAIAIGTLANSGIKASSAGTSLATGLTRLVKPTKQAKALMEKYGIEVKKTSEGNIDLDGTVQSLRKGLEGLTPVQKSQAISTIFGITAMKGWMSLINDTSSYEKLQNAMKNTTGATQQMMNELQKSGSYAFDVMKSSINDLGISIGNALAPALIEGAELITDLTSKFSNWITYMQENEPKMLKFIGGIALIGVVVPPIIMALGGLALSISSITGLFGGISKVLADFKAKSILAKTGAEGLGTAMGSKGLKGIITGLATELGSVATVALPLLVLALGAVGTAIGDNHNALDWLQDKWGTFGSFIATSCEMLNGTIGTLFKNIGVLIKGIGRMVDALKPGGETPAEAWNAIMSEINYNIKVGNSRVEGEMSRSMKNINQMSSRELGFMKTTFSVVMKEWGDIAEDGGKKLSERLSTRLSSMNQTTIETLRGTSDTMAVLFNGIFENMNKDDAMRTFQSNIKTMLDSGIVDITTLQKEFTSAFSYIEKNASDSSSLIAKESSQMFKALKDGANLNEMTTGITSQLQNMNIETVNRLRDLGASWRWIFRGITEDGLANGKDYTDTIKRNLEDLAQNDPKFIETLKSQMTTGLEQIKTTSAEKLNEVGQVLKENGIENGQEIIKGLQEGTTSVEDIFSQLGEEGSMDLMTTLSGLSEDAKLGGTEIGKNLEQGAKEGMVNLPQSVKDELGKAGISIDEQGNVIVDNMAEKARQASQTYVDNLNQNLPQLSQVSKNIENQLSGIDNVRLGNVTKQLSEINRWLGLVQNNAIQCGISMTALTILPFGNTTRGLSEINNWLMRTSNRARDSRTFMLGLTNLPFGNTTKGLSEVNNWLMRTSNRAKDTSNALKLIVQVTYGSVTKGLSEINKWLTSVKSSAINTTTALKNMANVKFGSLTHALSQVASWLGTVKTKANVATTAVSNVKKGKMIEEQQDVVPSVDTTSIEQAVATRASRDINLSNFKTSGGLYTPTSFSSKAMANLNKPTVQKEDKSNQVLDLLTQLIQAQADKTVELVINLDGRQIAKASSKFMQEEMNALNARKARLGGNL